MEYYRQIVIPILNKFDSETMHNVARAALHLAESVPGGLGLIEQFAYGRKRFTDPRLQTSIGGVRLDNPTMVGAGWDKQGKTVLGLWMLGFSSVEVGTVPPLLQDGNPKPRQWIIAPGVSLDCLGFNSPGMEAVGNNLDWYNGLNIPIGISLGKNKATTGECAVQDYVAVADYLYENASYFAINVSSPNTPGLRALQDKEPLREIVSSVKAVVDRKGQVLRRESLPIFIKIAPDLTKGAVSDVIQVVVDHSLAGVIATNTTNNPEIKAKYGSRWARVEGGLSGDDADFRSMTTRMVEFIYQEAGKQLDIIGVGGVKDTATALEKIMAGAKAVQVVTAIRQYGPTLPGRINRDLVGWMDKEGVNDIKEVVGSRNFDALRWFGLLPLYTHDLLRKHG